MDYENDEAWVQVFSVINAAVYFAALIYFGATVWRAAVVALLVLVAASIGVGRTVLLRGGFVMALLFLSAWAGVTPRMVAQLALP